MRQASRCGCARGKWKTSEGFHCLFVGRFYDKLLYAMVLEQLFPQQRVEGGRLYYCTQTGGFLAVDTPLDAQSREALGLVVRTLRGSRSPRRRK